MILQKNSRLIFLGILILFILIQLIFSSYIPIWDGQEYYANCLIPAINTKFNLFNFSCFTHPTIMYMLFLGIIQFFSQNTYFFVHLANIILGLLAINSFFEIVNLLDGDKKNNCEKILITAIFAFFPIFGASLLNLNVDFPVVVFFLAFLASVIRKRGIISAIFGLFLVFSKETGIILYFLSISATYFVANKKSLSIANIKKNALIFSPFFIFLVYLFFRSFLFRGSFMWIQKGSPVYMLLYLFPYDLGSRFLYAGLTLIFLINFNWIFILAICLNLLKNGFKYLLATPVRKLIFFLFLSAVYILTRYKTFSNPRYFLPLYPLLILVFYSSIMDLLKSSAIRRLFLFFIFILFFLSNFFTLDPLSKKIYGTFSFGRFEMLKMTSLSGECCGFGRDQLVYNFQYTMFHYLQNQIYSDIKPDNNTYILTRDNVNRYLGTGLDKKSFQRTASQIKTNLIFPKYIEFKDFSELKQKPKIVYFIEYPNFQKEGNIYKRLRRQYKISHYKKYCLLGYTIDVYKLTLP